MKKITSFVAVVLITALNWHSNAQTYVQENFNTGMPGTWTITDGGAATGDSWIAGQQGVVTIDGSDCAFVDSDAFGNGVDMIETLTTPSFNASTAIAIFLDFDQYFNWIGSDTAAVDVFDGTNWVRILTQNGSDVGASGTPDQQHIDITAYKNANMKVRFYFDDGNVWAWYWLVDNVHIYNNSCPQPSVLSATNIVGISADLGWTENGTATNWQIEWGTSGFAQGTGNLVLAGANPYNLTGLTPMTSYDYYVRALCGPGDASGWVGPFTFNTPCGTFSTPWLDNVEAHTPTTTLGLSNCWNATATGNYAWGISGTGTTPSVGTGPLVAQSGTNYFFTEASVGLAGDVAELYTPNIDLTGLAVPSLEFYYHMFGGIMGNLYIDVFDGTWTTVDSIIGAQQTAQGDAWIKRYVMLTSFSGIVQIRFRAVGAGTFQGDIAIDDITIREAPSCPQPSALTAINVAGFTADLSWFENGTATTWQIEWGNAGFAQGTGTLVLTGTNPHNLTGLSPATSYDYYVRAVCGGGDFSFWVGPLNFSTTISCPQPSVLSVTNVIGVSADLGWTENGTATNWQIEWGTSGFVQGAGTLLFTGTNPHNLTGLTINTVYDFYVRTVCGVGDTSSWVGPFTFNTPCNIFSAPWLDNVEAHNSTTSFTTSNCWDAIDVGAYSWAISSTGATPSSGTGPLAAKSGTNFFFTEATNGAVGDIAELYSPNIDLNTLTTPRLNFYYHMFGITMGDLFIDVYDGNWNTVDSIMGAQQVSQADLFLLKSIDLSSFSGIIQIRFRAITAGTFEGDICLDDIAVQSTTGIADNSENVSMTVYPNPNNGIFTLNVTTNNVNELAIKVQTLQGQIVYSKNNFDNIGMVQEKIDLSNNAKGVYFINVTSDKGIVTHKIVLQ